MFPSAIPYVSCACLVSLARAVPGAEGQHDLVDGPRAADSMLHVHEDDEYI
jgi:hypothetical protein